MAQRSQSSAFYVSIYASTTCNIFIRKFEQVNFFLLAYTKCVKNKNRNIIKNIIRAAILINILKADKNMVLGALTTGALTIGGLTIGDLTIAGV